MKLKSYTTGDHTVLTNWINAQSREATEEKQADNVVEIVAIHYSDRAQAFTAFVTVTPVNAKK